MERTLVGPGYYREMGRAAYLRLSSALEGKADLSGGTVFWELAQNFGDFVQLLAEVGGRARGDRSVDLLRLYDRYRKHGTERDRARLLRHGLAMPTLGLPESIH